MSGTQNSPIPDDKMMAYLYDDVDDADIFGFGDDGDEEGTKTNDDYEETPENRLDYKSLEVLNENQVLKETIQRLRLENDKLDQRISEVYKTAKREIERKDRRIRELQDETNNILFRRNNNRGVSYRPNHPISAKFEEQPLQSVKRELTNNEEKNLKNKADIPEAIPGVSSSKNDNITDKKYLNSEELKSNSAPLAFKNQAEYTVENTAQEICRVQSEDTPLKRFTNEDFQQFKTDYKIPKKNADCSHESEQKWSKSNVLGDRDSLSPPRQDKSGKYPTTPSRNKRYQDNTRLRGCPKIPGSPRRFKSDNIDSQDDPKLANRRRGRSNTPSRCKSYQDKPKTPSGSLLRCKSRSASAENLVDAGQLGQRVHGNTPSRRNRSSSRSPQRHKNYQDRSRKHTTSARSPLRNKSRSKSAGNRVESDPRDIDRKRVYPNTPSRKNTIIVTGTKHRSSSRSPQRHKNNQSPRQHKTTTRSPLRQKSRSTSVENSIEAARKVTSREREPDSPLKEHFSESSQRHKKYQDRPRQPKSPRRSPIRHKSRSASVEADAKDTKRDRERSNSPSREHTSSSRSSQSHKNYQDRPRQPKSPRRSPIRHKSRSASVEADAKDTKREKERSNTPSREHTSSSRSSQSHKNYQDRPRQPKSPRRSPIRHKSRSTSVEANAKDTKRERKRSNSPSREHRSSSRSSQRHKNYQDRPRQPKPPPESLIRHESSVGTDSKDTDRKREQSHSPSRLHGSSSRSSQRFRNCQDRPRQPKPPPGSPRRNKSRSASAENKGDASKMEENRIRNQEKHNRFGPLSTRNIVAVDQYEQKRPPRTPSGSPPRTTRRRTPSPRRNVDKRRQSRPPQRATRGRSIERRLGWGSKRGIYTRLNNDSVSSRRRTDYRRRNDYKKGHMEQLRRRLKQRSIERDPETFKFDRQESYYSGDEDDICKMTDEQIQRRIQEKQKELMAEKELSDIEEGQLTDEDKNINLPKNAKNDEKCKKFNKSSKKETYKDLLKETKNITKQVQKDMLGIKKPEISPNVETKLLETIKSPDAVDPRLNPSSCDSKPEKPRARINFEAYKKRREEEGCSDLARIGIYQEIDIENHKISEDSATIIAESQKRDSAEHPIYIKEKSDNIDQEPEEKEVENLIESDYKYTPAVDDEDAKFDFPEDKNSSNSFYDDFIISEDDDRFGRSDSSSAENKKKQAQKDIEINAIEIGSKSETKAFEIIKSLDAEDMNSNPIVKDSQPEAIVGSINFETFNQQKGVSYFASVESKPEVDITNEKMSKEQHYKDKTSEKSDQGAESKSAEKLIEPDYRDPPVIESNVSDVDDKLTKTDSSCAQKLDKMSMSKDNVKILDKIGSCCSEKIEIGNLPIIDVEKCEAKIPKVNILSNVVITAGFNSSPQTCTKSNIVESSVESIESIQKAVLNSGTENKALEFSEIKDNIGQKTDQNNKELINQLFGEMTPSPRKPSPEPIVKKNSRQVQQAKRQLKLQVNPVKTIKKSPRSKKKVELKQLLMQSEIVENKEVETPPETRTVATKLEDLKHNNPSFIPFLHGDNKAFDTPNTYIMKKNEQKRKPAAKNSKVTEKPKVEAKKRGVFRIKLQSGRKKKKIQNYQISSSEFSSDSHSDCQSPEPENNKKLKMESKKRETRQTKTAQQKIVEAKKKKTTNNARSDVIENEKPDCDIKIESEKIMDDDKSEDIEYTETKTNKRSTAKSVKPGDNVTTKEKCDITKDISENSHKLELKPNKRSRAKSVKVGNKVRFEAKVTDISDDTSKNIENNQTQTNNRCQVKVLNVADNVVIAEEKCKQDTKCDSSENTEAKTIKRCRTVIIQNSQDTKISKRNRAKPVKVVKTTEKLSDKTKDNLIIETITNERIQAKPVEVSEIAKMDEKIPDHNEDKSENSKNTNKRSNAKAAKVEVVKIEFTVINEYETENIQNTETKTRSQADPEKVDDTLDIEEKIPDFSKYTYSEVTTRRRIKPKKVGEVTPSNKRKLDTQEDTIRNKLPKLEQSPLPHMENMLKQLENKSSPQTCGSRDSSNKITAVNVEDGVVEININSKDVSLGPMDNLFMLEDLSNYLNVSDRKTETNFSNFQLKNTSTPKKPTEKKEDNDAKNLVENEMKEDKVSPGGITSGSSKEYLKAPLRRDRTRRIRVGMVHLPS